jgi:hypothetical protein
VGGFRFKDSMNRTATTEALKALIATHAAEIAALKVENEKLAQRVVHLEEQLRLERLHRYAPRSEKLTEAHLQRSRAGRRRGRGNRRRRGGCRLGRRRSELLGGAMRSNAIRGNGLNR